MAITIKGLRNRWMGHVPFAGHQLDVHDQIRWILSYVHFTGRCLMLMSISANGTNDHSQNIYSLRNKDIKDNVHIWLGFDSAWLNDIRMKVGPSMSWAGWGSENQEIWTSPASEAWFTSLENYIMLISLTHGQPQCRVRPTRPSRSHPSHNMSVFILTRSPSHTPTQ